MLQIWSCLPLVLWFACSNLATWSIDLCRYNLPLVRWVRLVKLTHRKSCSANAILGSHNQKSFSLLLCGPSGLNDNRQKRYRNPHPIRGKEQMMSAWRGGDLTKERKLREALDYSTFMGGGVNFIGQLYVWLSHPQFLAVMIFPDFFWSQIQEWALILSCM